MAGRILPRLRGRGTAAGGGGGGLFADLEGCEAYP